MYFILELNIPRKMLPTIKSSSSCFGSVGTWMLLQQRGQHQNSFDMQQLSRYSGISITGVLGDQQAALFVSDRWLFVSYCLHDIHTISGIGFVAFGFFFSYSICGGLRLLWM